MSDAPPDAHAAPTPPAGGRPYGPNTAAVRRFLQRFAALGPREWDQAAAAYADAAGTAAMRAADRDLARAVDQAGRQAERDAVVGPLVQLLQGAPRATASAAPTADPADAVLAELPAVAEAALAAALALVMRDLLPTRAFDALYAPFAALVPAAALD